MTNPIKRLRYRYFRHKGYSHYHARIAADFWWTTWKDVQLKWQELAFYLQAPPFAGRKKTVSVAVLGCANEQYIKHYPKLFANILGAPVEVTIYEVAVKPLARYKDAVVKHDCTKPLPQKHDFIYSHMLINFLKPGQQQAMVDNSRKSLNPGGIIFHVYNDREDEPGQYLGKVTNYYNLNSKLVEDGSLYQSLYW